MVCGNFILPEPANYVFFYAVFNLRNLLYIIKPCSNLCAVSIEPSNTLKIFGHKKPEHLEITGLFAR